MSHPPGPCVRCGAAKLPGRGNRYCAKCYEQRAAEVREVQRPGRHLRTKDAPEGQAWCSRCQTYLPFDHFGNSRSRKSGKSAYCKPCYSDFLHERRLAAYYDMTPDEYQQMLASQDGRCAICLSLPGKNRRLAVDHDHKTGDVRGLLCTRCNHKVLGGAKENPSLLRRAAGYLERTLLAPQESAPVTKFAKGVHALLESHGCTLAGIETEIRSRFNPGDLERVAGDLQRKAIVTGRYRWLLMIARAGKPVRDAYVVMPLWLFADLLADDFGARVSGGADTNESVA